VLGFIVLTDHLPGEFVSSLKTSLAGFPTVSHLYPVSGYPHITKAYNQAARACTDDILCFVHDDVQFGFVYGQFAQALEVVNHSGIVGVCGATRLEDNGTWWQGLSREEVNACCRGAIGSPHGMLRWNGFGQVVVVDGVLLMMRRAVFDALGGFNEQLTGAHFYDVDISLRAHRAGHVNRVVELPVFHKSTGNYNAAWENSRSQFLALVPNCRERLVQESV
jgi:GT2 family glycosyltransferase